jgi:DNA polymerase elongation subunit (family B)
MDHRNILIIDIETVSAVSSYDELDDRLKKQWDRKASFLKNEEDLPPDQMFRERGAIYAEFGKVVCIGVGLFTGNKNDRGLRIKSYISEAEKEVLNGFKELVDTKLKNDDLLLCAHNGKEFDFPYLCRRYLVNGIPIPSVLQISGKKPWEVNHIDTMELWKFGDRKNFTSLDLLAALFNIDSSKSDMDGSMVSSVYYQERDLDKIVRYCMQDVFVTANLYLKMNLADPIPEDRVTFVM